jgi:hypothetical protein
MIYETLHRKLKIGQHESTKNRSGHSCYLYHGSWLLKILKIWIWCSGRVGNSCSTSGTCRVTVKPHELLNTKEDNEIRGWKFRSLLGTDRYKKCGGGQNAPFYVIRSPKAIKKYLVMLGSIWLSLIAVIVSMSWMNQGWDHQTSFILPLLTEMSVPGKGGTVYLSCWRYRIWLFLWFPILLWNCSNCVVFFCLFLLMQTCGGAKHGTLCNKVFNGN